ncbi:hypothetical protein Amet_3989 [Alkaliphilus metalliredigens QYMF]|uniref:Uncharacterized protein n=2 Tax=Alkaliphilus TaxID=114627 RepID=A6TV54_ALKMQ|nr:hypothetical protein Amet_3989 [Alkaliphilus metalliredigens QYMF]
MLIKKGCIMTRNKQRILAVVLILVSFFAILLQNVFLTMFIGVIYIVLSIYWIVKGALNHLLECLGYLTFYSPIFSLILTSLLIENKVIGNSIILQYLIFGILYILVSLIIILFGRTKMVKLATLIIAQVMTVFFIILNIVINLIPISVLNDFLISSGTTLEELQLVMGYDSRTLFITMLQFLFAPVLIMALLMYLVIEIKEYIVSRIDDNNIV